MGVREGGGPPPTYAVLCKQTPMWPVAARVADVPPPALAIRGVACKQGAVWACGVGDGGGAPSGFSSLCACLRAHVRCVALPLPGHMPD